MLNFDGRIDGKTYYIRVFSSILLIVALSILIMDTESLIIGTLYITALITWLIFFLAQIKQRANDIGKAPMFVTLVSFWTPARLFLGVFNGEKNKNRFGSPPKTT